MNDMARLIELDDDELETITEVLREYERAVNAHEITGFGQSNEEEAADTRALIIKLERAAL
jgi:hypothetical protein